MEMRTLWSLFCLCIYIWITLDFGSYLIFKGGSILRKSVYLINNYHTKLAGHSKITTEIRNEIIWNNLCNILITWVFVSLTNSSISSYSKKIDRPSSLHFFSVTELLCLVEYVVSCSIHQWINTVLYRMTWGIHLAISSYNNVVIFKVAKDGRIN